VSITGWTVIVIISVVAVVIIIKLAILAFVMANDDKKVDYPVKSGREGRE
jgi:flagellar motor component MotA